MKTETKIELLTGKQVEKIHGNNGYGWYHGNAYLGNNWKDILNKEAERVVQASAE